MSDWLALAIGNSRLHWAWIHVGQVQATWDTQHHDAVVAKKAFQTEFQSIAPDVTLPEWCQRDSTTPPLYIASVVPQQTQIWQQYAQARVLTLSDVPLRNAYPTLGVDRALAVWGASQTYGAPVLVIDGGTAMTLTGINQDCALVGGTIFPGVRVLFQTLQRSTANLPQVTQAHALPPIWGTDTEAAIQSGIVHTVAAGLVRFITDWLVKYPDSSIVFTGGDGELLQRWYESSVGNARESIQPSADPISKTQDSNRARQISLDSQLIFAGMLAVVQPGYPTAHRS